MGVGRAQGHIATPGLTSRPVELGAVLDEQPEEVRPAAAADGVREQRSLVRVSPPLSSSIRTGSIRS